MNTNYPKIKVIDNLKPEDAAMLQALYSRSPASVDDHLEKLKVKGSGSFMDKFYVGYGHASIGDCGVTTVFIEGVTMLVAKALQDWPLYSGQESSTRYMDFSSAAFHNPLGTEEGQAIQESWRQFYLDALGPMREHILEKYPRQEGEDEKVYERAVNARVFDVLRSFLPAGATTNLSWTTNLRQASDHLKWLMFHPDQGVEAAAKHVYNALAEKYPNSFRPPRGEHHDYLRRVMRDHYFFQPHPDEAHLLVRVAADFSLGDFSTDVLDLLADRPRGAEIPWFLTEHGVIESVFSLDFGSFRDLQRHRNGVVRMPLLTTDFGFNDWYLDEMPEHLAVEAATLLEIQDHAIRQLPCDPVTAQNYIAMGYEVPCRVTQGLPAFVYRLELRSGKTVHPSLRRVVREEIRQFRELFPGVTLHVDEDPDSWTVRRGKQTIEAKP